MSTDSLAARLQQYVWKATVAGLGEEALEAAGVGSDAVTVTRCSRGEGDYQTQVALALATRLKRSPKDLAEDVVRQLSEEGFCGDLGLTNVHSSGPGFINMQLSSDTLTQLVADTARGITPPQPARRQKVLLDFASPNAGKDLHVGHMRSAVIGDTLARVLEWQGHEVTRHSHVGDAGLPVAMVVNALESRWIHLTGSGLCNAFGIPGPGSGAYASIMKGDVPMHELSETYKSQKQAIQQQKEEGEIPKGHADIGEAVQQVVQDIQSFGWVGGVVVDEETDSVRVPGLSEEEQTQGDGMHILMREILAGVWAGVVRYSSESNQALWRALGVTVEDRGESFYTDGLQDVLKELAESGVAIKSQGALVAFTHGDEEAPMLLQKADGGCLYATTDAVCLKRRLAAGYERLIYITDQAQRQHFSQLFRLGEMAGWLDRERVDVEHAWFGVVTGEDGKKLSSRDSGEDITLRGLLEECAAVAGERLADDVADREAAAEVLGNAAIRYYELSHQRTKNYKLSYDHALAFKGNTSVYITYALARLQSLKKRLAAELDLDVAEVAPAPASRTDTVDSFLKDQAERVEGWRRITEAVQARLPAGQAEGDTPAALRELQTSVAGVADSIDATSSRLAPHLLAEETHRLAKDFHGFYEASNVVRAVQGDVGGEGGEGQSSVQLIAACAGADNSLRWMMHLLGVDRVSHM